MPGKDQRDFRVTVDTDDPNLFDLLPAEGEYEAVMWNITTGDHWRKEGIPPRAALADTSNSGGRIVEDEDDGG